jgi:anti-anti-sigma regulatory factor
MKKRLEVEVQQIEQVTLVTMRGAISEDSRLAEVTKQIKPGKVVINTAQVAHINSLGARDWVKWIATLERQGVESYFVECSPTVMVQANSVANFIGRGKILSFQAPYFCPACGCDQPTLLRVEEVRGEPGVRVPTRRCVHCDQLLEFTEREGFYLSFLSRSGAGEPSPEVERALVIARRRPPSEPVSPTSKITETVSSPQPLRVEEEGEDEGIPGRNVLLTWVIIAVAAAALGILAYVMMRRW